MVWLLLFGVPIMLIGIMAPRLRRTWRYGIVASIVAPAVVAGRAVASALLSPEPFTALWRGRLMAASAVWLVAASWRPSSRCLPSLCSIAHGPPACGPR